MMSNEESLCSGSLIHSLWVITTASCVFSSRSLRLRFGSVTYYTGGVVLHNISIHFHPEYNPYEKTNDVALLRLSHSVSDLLPGISLIELANLNITALHNHLIKTIGYGLSDSLNVSPVLQFSYGELLPNSDPRCKNDWDDILIGPNFLCASIYQEEADAYATCAGETGSPLVLDIEGKSQLIGIAIFNAGNSLCQDATSLYTNLATVAGWIRRTI